ncbi:uncharacterized protein [Coffea arabica]|uniref:Reverse transcriptase zinc-binding domain-containing protein n=1 Tax=Coffea arabica TaxID=13443 RepID=A0A6P6TZK8_COFAR|nr:uncharacterized protein LOC113706161 [Coffea arabica]
MAVMEPAKIAPTTKAAQFEKIKRGAVLGDLVLEVHNAREKCIVDDSVRCRESLNNFPIEGDLKDGRVKSRRREGMMVQKVSELVRDGRWDRELIKQVFEKEEGRNILRIPLGVQPLKDRIYWNFSPTGMYTVKSGYRLAKKRRRRGWQGKADAGSSCSRVGTNLSWTFLWGLNMKHKLKHFIWKCLHGVLPVNAVVRERCSKGDPMCISCGESTETIEHCLFLCHHAKAVWKIAPLSWDGLEMFSNSFWHWWEELKGAAKEENGRERIILSVNLLWQIWKSRNARQFDENHGDPRMVVEKALREWREYQETQEEVRGTGESQARKDEAVLGWRRPRAG